MIEKFDGTILPDAELDTMAVDAMMALVDGVFGPLRAPDTFRGHVTAIIDAATKLGMDDPGAWNEAVHTLRTYLEFLDTIAQ